MKTAKSDLNDLNQTIGIVEQHRIKFKDISDSELASRKAFVADTKGLIDTIEVIITRIALAPALLAAVILLLYG
jgi:hypothetical protein